MRRGLRALRDSVQSFRQARCLSGCGPIPRDSWWPSPVRTTVPQCASALPSCVPPRVFHTRLVVSVEAAGLERFLLLGVLGEVYNLASLTLGRRRALPLELSRIPHTAVQLYERQLYTTVTQGQIKQNGSRSDSDSYTVPVAYQKAPLGSIPIYMTQAKWPKQKIDRKKLFVAANAAERRFERLAAGRR